MQPSSDPHLQCTLALLTLTTAAAIAALTLRQFRCARRLPFAASLSAGAIAGVLLHLIPSLMPSLATLHGSIFDGGAAEIQALEKLDTEHAALRTALAETGVSPDALTELVARQAPGRTAAATALDNAHQHRQQALRSFGLWAMGLGLFSLGALHARHPVPLRFWPGILPAAFGALAAGVPAALLSHWLLQSPWTSAAAHGCITAASGAWATSRSRSFACARTPVFESTGLLAFLLPLGTVAAANRSCTPSMWLFAAALLGFVSFRSLRPLRSPGVRRTTAWFSTVVALPTATACAWHAVRPIDSAVFSFAFWRTAGVFVFCFVPLRFAGSWLGWRLATGPGAVAQSVLRLHTGTGIAVTACVISTHLWFTGIHTDTLAAALTAALLIECASPISAGFLTRRRRSKTPGLLQRRPV